MRRRVATSSRATGCVVLAVVLTTGCATASLDVLVPVPVPIDNVKLVIEDETRGDVSPDQMRNLKRTLTAELEQSGIEVLAPSSTVPAARVVGRIESFDPGLRALRFISRYGFGTGVLDSSWLVEDPYSNAVARCRIEGSISMGTFGGDFQDVQEETGKALARFLRGDIR
ncbi:MAG: hypothetical protein AB1689_00530 [Thermodesulfobacteriota bacterium]